MNTNNSSQNYFATEKSSQGLNVTGVSAQEQRPR